MNDGDSITQNSLNTIIYKMRDTIQFDYNLRFLEPVNNEYCNITVDLGENTNTNTELIITHPITITLTEPYFNTLKYYIQVEYYELNTDINNTIDNPLITYEQELNSGENILSFNKNPVYLQLNFKLIIKI